MNRFKPAGVQDMGTPSDEESDASAAALRRAEREQNASVRLYVFLTKKKAKTRMADLEETAFLLRLDVGKEGCICFGKSCGSFDQVCTCTNVNRAAHIPESSSSSPRHGVKDWLRKNILRLYETVTRFANKQLHSDRGRRLQSKSVCLS